MKGVRKRKLISDMIEAKKCKAYLAGRTLFRDSVSFVAKESSKSFVDDANVESFCDTGIFERAVPVSSYLCLICKNDDFAAFICSRLWFSRFMKKVARASVYSDGQPVSSMQSKRLVLAPVICFQVSWSSTVTLLEALYQLYAAQCEATTSLIFENAKASSATT